MYQTDDVHMVFGKVAADHETDLLSRPDAQLVGVPDYRFRILWNVHGLHPPSPPFKVESETQFFRRSVLKMTGEGKGCMPVPVFVDVAVLAAMNVSCRSSRPGSPAGSRGSGSNATSTSLPLAQWVQALRLKTGDSIQLQVQGQVIVGLSVVSG